MLPQHSTGKVEYYTPKPWIDRVRFVLGSIDLDPASCEKANKTVGASVFYTKDDDGMEQSWKAKNLFINPPYGRGVTLKFALKFLLEFKLGHFENGIMLVNSNTQTKWFQALMKICMAALPSKRISFIDEKGIKQSSPPNANVFFLLSKDKDVQQRFIDTFSKVGLIVERIA